MVIPPRSLWALDHETHRQLALRWCSKAGVGAGSAARPVKVSLGSGAQRLKQWPVVMLRRRLVAGKVGPVTKHIVSSLLDGASAPKAVAGGNAAPKPVGGKVGPATKHIVSSLLDGASAPKAVAGGNAPRSRSVARWDQ